MHLSFTLFWDFTVCMGYVKVIHFQTKVLHINQGWLSAPHDVKHIENEDISWFLGVSSHLVRFLYTKLARWPAEVCLSLLPTSSLLDSELELLTVWQLMDTSSVRSPVSRTRLEQDAADWGESRWENVAPEESPFPSRKCFILRLGPGKLAL